MISYSYLAIRKNLIKLLFHFSSSAATEHISNLCIRKKKKRLLTIVFQRQTDIQTKIDRDFMSNIANYLLWNCEYIYKLTVINKGTAKKKETNIFLHYNCVEMSYSSFHLVHNFFFLILSLCQHVNNIHALGNNTLFVAAAFFKRIFYAKKKKSFIFVLPSKCLYISLTSITCSRETCRITNLNIHN